MSLLILAAVFLGAAVIAVPLFKRLGFGAVLGYLAAGAAIGPWGLHVVRDVESVLHFAEFGVVLLLFIIGLELQPSRLWTMRRPVFLQGGLQVAVTALLIGAVAYALGVEWRTALVAGLALSLSSTAFALQLLAEKGQLVTRHGRTAFSILLFQDMAAIPIVALVPLLGLDSQTVASAADVLWPTLQIVAAVAAVIVGGHFLLRHALRLIARAEVREIFTACALLTVIGTALIVQQAGLSMALGAFLAGVLLADSEFRHALEADIEPFKGLLLGLFFMAVGMSVNFGLLATQPGLVVALVVGLTALKAAVLYAIGVMSGHPRRSSRSLAIYLSQGGEFAFVIFTLATEAGVLTSARADLLVLVVSLSLAVTPLLLFASEKLAARAPSDPPDRPYDTPIDAEGRVIIAGFGRYGQIVGRILGARRIPFTALEVNPEQVDFVAHYGNRIYYGDTSRYDVLRAARAHEASLFVIAIDDVETSIRTAETVTRYFPNLRILARARNREHAYRLMDLGVKDIWRETFHSSLETAHAVLTGLGLTDSEARRTVETFRDHDERRMAAQHEMYRDDKRMVASTREWAAELERLLEQDAAEREPPNS